jgi:hypothetical protein
VHGRTGYVSERTRPRTAATHASELLLRTCRRRAATRRAGRHEQAARAATDELGRQGARHATTSRASHASRPPSRAGLRTAPKPRRGHDRMPAARAGLHTAPKPRQGHGRAAAARAGLRRTPGRGSRRGRTTSRGGGSRARAARRAKNARAGADRGRGGCAGCQGAAPGATAELRPPWPSRAIRPNRAGANRGQARGPRRAGAGQGDAGAGPSRARTSRVATPWPRARPRHGRDVRRAERDEVENEEEKGRGERSGTGSPRGATATRPGAGRRFSCGQAMGEERGVGGAICAREREEREFVGERR